LGVEYQLIVVPPEPGSVIVAVMVDAVFPTTADSEEGLTEIRGSSYSVTVSAGVAALPPLLSVTTAQ
jgi:hypothetical protein